MVEISGEELGSLRNMLNGLNKMLRVYSRKIDINFDKSEAIIAQSYDDYRDKYEEDFRLTAKGKTKLESIEKDTLKFLYGYLKKHLNDFKYSAFYGFDDSDNSYQMKIYSNNLLASFSVGYFEKMVESKELGEKFLLRDEKVKNKDRYKSFYTKKGFIYMSLKVALAPDAETVEKLKGVIDNFLLIHEYEINKLGFKESMAGKSEDEKKRLLAEIIKEKNSKEDHEWFSQNFPEISKSIAMTSFDSDSS